MNRAHFVNASLLMALLIGCTVAVRAADVPTNLASTRGAADDPKLAAFKQAIRAKYDLKERAYAAHDVETIVTRFYAADAIRPVRAQTLLSAAIKSGPITKRRPSRTRSNSTPSTRSSMAMQDGIGQTFGFFSTDGTKKVATVGWWCFGRKLTVSGCARVSTMW